MLWLGEISSESCNFYLIVAACKNVQADPSLRYTLHVPGTLSNQETTTTFFVGSRGEVVLVTSGQLVLRYGCGFMSLC